MSNTLPEEEESFADDAAGTLVYQAAKPLKKGFEPWHRPRKQFVRDRQWRSEMDDLLSSVGDPRDYLVKYLGLPGTDLLDIRHFHESLCLPRGLRLRFLGFNSAADPAHEGQSEINISLDEVRKLEFIDPRSEVVPDDFRTVGSDGSIAWQRTQEYGPYDVVNIDLCGGFAVDKPETVEDTIYKAMLRVVSLQSHSHRPWLLFLTTRVGNEHIHDSMLTKVTAAFSKNLRECPDFMRASRDLFGIHDETAVQTALGSQKGLLDVSITGICKWFLALGLAARPAWRVELKSVMGYQVNPALGAEDLVSVALRFTPSGEALVDPMRFTAVVPAAHDECSLATPMLGLVAGRQNVDIALAGDATLKSSIVRASKSLLGQARYDTAAYANWLANPPQKAHRRSRHK